MLDTVSPLREGCCESPDSIPNLCCPFVLHGGLWQRRRAETRMRLCMPPCRALQAIPTSTRCRRRLTQLVSQLVFPRQAASTAR